MVRKRQAEKHSDTDFKSNIEFITKHGTLDELKKALNLSTLIEQPELFDDLDSFIASAKKGWDESITAYLVNLQNDFANVLDRPKKRSRTRTTPEAAAAAALPIPQRRKAKAFQFFPPASASSNGNLCLVFNDKSEELTNSQIEELARIIFNWFDANEHTNVISEGIRLISHLGQQPDDPLKRNYMISSLLATISSSLITLHIQNQHTPAISVNTSIEELEKLGLSEDMMPEFIKEEYKNLSDKCDSHLIFEKSFALSIIALGFLNSLSNHQTKNEKDVIPFKSLESVLELRSFVLSNLISYYDAKLINNKGTTLQDYKLKIDILQCLLELYFSRREITTKLEQVENKKFDALATEKCLIDLVNIQLNIANIYKDEKGDIGKSMEYVKDALTVLRDIARFNEFDELHTNLIEREPIMNLFRQAMTAMTDVNKQELNPDLLLKIDSLRDEIEELLLPNTAECKAAIQELDNRFEVAEILVGLKS